MHSLKLRFAKDRLTLLLVIPVACLLVVSGVVLVDQFRQYIAAQKTSDLVSIASNFNRLVHELQKERGATAGYVSARREIFASIMIGQRDRTDAAWSSVRSVVNSLDPDAFVGGLSKKRAFLTEAAEDLALMRNTVENGSAQATEVIRRYSLIIDGMLGTVRGISLANPESDLVNSIIAFSSLLHMKESAGLERATGAIGFERRNFDQALLTEFMDYVARQNAFRLSFDTHATANQKVIFDSIKNDPSLAEVKNFRAVIMGNVVDAPVDSIAGAHLFNTYTRKIDLLKQVEDGLTDDLRAKVITIQDNARASLIELGGIVILALVVSFIVLLEVEKRAYVLEHTKRDAESANRAKSAFLSRMSHELRTPLNAIIGFSQFLVENPKDPLSEYQREYTGHIVSAGEHLLLLVNDVLDLAKLESGRSDLKMEDIYPSEIIDDCISINEPLAAKRNVSIINNMVEHADFMITADGLRLKQVMLNLLSNAAKYNRDGGSITVASMKTSEDRLHISVSDTGIGIPKDRFPYVFEPFDRLGVEHTQAEDGTGIGLTITKHLVEQMGGRIGFESVEGKGTTFWFELDIAREQEEIAWTDDLLVGVEAIDDDHKKLIAMVNQLGKRSLADSDVDTLMVELLDYTVYHFKREETVMETYGYTGLADHRESHVRLAEKATALATQWQETHEGRLLGEINLFLRSWLVNHIMNEDKKAFQFVGVTSKDIDKTLKSV